MQLRAALPASSKTVTTTDSWGGIASSGASVGAATGSAFDIPSRSVPAHPAVRHAGSRARRLARARRRTRSAAGGGGGAGRAPTSSTPRGSPSGEGRGTRGRPSRRAGPRPRCRRPSSCTKTSRDVANDADRDAEEERRGGDDATGALEPPATASAFAQPAVAALLDPREQEDRVVGRRARTRWRQSRTGCVDSSPVDRGRPGTRARARPKAAPIVSTFISNDFNGSTTDPVNAKSNVEGRQAEQARAPTGGGATTLVLVDDRRRLARDQAVREDVPQPAHELLRRSPTSGVPDGTTSSRQTPGRDLGRPLDPARPRVAPRTRARAVAGLRGENEVERRCDPAQVLACERVGDLARARRARQRRGVDPGYAERRGRGARARRASRRSRARPARAAASRQCDVVAQPRPVGACCQRRGASALRRGPSTTSSAGSETRATVAAATATSAPPTAIDERNRSGKTASDPIAAATVSALKTIVRPAVERVARGPRARGPCRSISSR